MSTQAQPVTGQTTDPMLAAFTARAQQPSTAAPATTSATSSDPMLDAFTARKKSTDAGVSSAAAKPGAYQQSPGAPVHNAREEAASPFTESVTSVLPKSLGGQTGALMKREGESDAQFFARAVEAGKHANVSLLEEEHQANKKAAGPTAAAALVAGPAQLAGEMAASAPFVASQTAALGITGEATGEVLTGPSLARMGMTLGAQGAKAALRWVEANPVKAFAILQAATAAGIGPKKILQLFHLVGE